jgi:hypothetical protein
MRGFGGFLTFLIIFKLYNGGLERWAKNPHVSNAETVIKPAREFFRNNWPAHKTPV